MSRRSARATALKALYQVDVARTDPSSAIEAGAEGEELTAKDREFARELVDGTLAHLAEIDAMIARLAIDWTIDRLGRVDRNVLRMAIFELRHPAVTPPEVVASEAVELAKTYGDSASGRFVNGILGALLKQRA